MHHRTLLAAALATMLLGGAAAAAHAAPGKIQAAPPPPGSVCSADDLGKRYHWIETAEVTPVITHYTAISVTEGTTGSREYELSEQTVVTAEVNKSAEFGPFSIAGKVLSLVGLKVGFSVKNTKATTKAERLKIVWNFTKAGYYGLYKGTRRVEGTHISLNCSVVSRPGETPRTEWVRRPGGTYTTFSFIEEGSISCDDTVPPGTLRALARAQLGCESGAKPKPKPVTAAQPTAEPAAGVQGLPTGFVCDPGFYRITSRNQDALTASLKGEVKLQPSTGDTSQKWQVCHSSAATAFPEYAFVSYAGTRFARCLQVPSRKLDDGVVLTTYPCGGGADDKHHRFYVYKDVAPSTAIGLQNMNSMAMIAPLNGELVSGGQIAQYDDGQANGSGTFYLDKVS